MTRAPDGRDAPDAEVVAGLRAGEPWALEAAYTRHRAAIFGFLCRLARDRELASDLFQNTWVKLARAARRLRPDTDLRGWLFTVARNEYRSHRRWQRLDFTRLLALTPPEPSHAVEPADRRELEDALARLNDADREVLLLIAVENFEPHAAAAVLGVSPEAVRQRLSRARRRLQALLNPTSTEGDP